MALTLDALEILDTIERAGSFAAAAQELGRVPSALTYAVRKLEDDLDVLLFDRSGHRARLTTVGRTLLDDGRHLLRAAEDLECRIKRLARGWEVHLRVGITALVDFERVAPLIERFYQAHGQGATETESPTRIRIVGEVLAGAWEALLDDRVDLAIVDDASHPAGHEVLRTRAAIQTRQLGEVAFVFCVAPHHPLAILQGQGHSPLSAEQIAQHRAVAIADSARRVPARTVGLMDGQDVLTVPSMQAKVAAQVRGLGCGWLPEPWARPWIRRGLLSELAVDPPRAPAQLLAAWRAPVQGKALKYWLRMLAEPEVQAMLSELVPVGMTR